MGKNKIIIKIGSSTLLTKRFCVHEFRLSHIAKQVKILQAKEWSVILILSGAVAIGNRFANKKAAAGVGQVEMISASHRIFKEQSLHIAQILLTQDCMRSSRVRCNLKRTCKFYFHENIIPIFNENDVIDLYSFGGNDHLAHSLANLFDVKEVVMLSSYETNGFGVGGGESKQKVMKHFHVRNIHATIIDGKKRNCLLEGV